MSAKKFSWLICSLVVLSVLVTACGPQPTEVVKEVEVTRIVEVTAEAAPAAGKTCEGIKIVFFPGGPPGCPFGTVVYNGAVAAAADLGADVEYMFSDWNTEKMVTQFKEAVATKPDGIAIMGHPRAKGSVTSVKNCTSPAICSARRLSGGLALDPEIGPWSGGFCPSQPAG
jgi:ABC-type sugar transport system substrate-binding protein